MALRPSEVGAKNQRELNRMMDTMRMLDYEREFNDATDTFDRRKRTRVPNEFDNVLDAVAIEQVPPQKQKDEFDDIFG